MVYTKDALRVGRFYVPTRGEWLDVTPERMARWVDTFRAMRSRGVSVDLTVDHAAGVEGKRGKVTDLRIEDDRLVFDADPNAAGQQLLAGADDAEVSVEVEADFADGLGNVYPEALTAISIVRKPVVPGQDGWKIAASLTANAKPRAMRICASLQVPAGTDDEQALLMLSIYGPTTKPNHAPDDWVSEALRHHNGEASEAERVALSRRLEREGINSQDADDWVDQAIVEANAQ